MLVKLNLHLENHIKLKDLMVKLRMVTRGIVCSLFMVIRSLSLPESVGLLLIASLGKSPSFTCEDTVTRTQEQQSATELYSFCSRPPLVEEGEEVEQFAGSLTARNWSPVTAPYGVSFNTGGTRNKAVNCGYKDYTFGNTCESRGELPDTGSLRARLEKKLALEGVGISMDCADLLNNSMDVFLKRLIEPCLGIASSKRTNPNNLEI